MCSPYTYYNGTDRLRRSITGLIYVDDEPDGALENHGGEQIHVYTGDAMLPELPEIHRNGKASCIKYAIKINEEKGPYF